MSERRLLQCDNCEATLELDNWDNEDDPADTIADHGWHVLITPTTDEDRNSDTHFCGVRCLAVWATARAYAAGDITSTTA